MKDLIQKYLQVGAVQWMIHPPANYPILGSVKTTCYDEYLDTLEIAHIGDQEIRDKVGDMLAQGHAKMCYGAQSRLLRPKLNPNDLGEGDRKKAKAVLMDSTDETRYMGAERIAFLAGRWEPKTKDQVYAQLLRITRAVCSHAATEGIMVELRVSDLDTDKAALVGPAPYAARFAADMRTICDNFGLLVDPSYLPTTYEIFRFVTQTLRSYIIHLYIGNAVVKEGFEAYGDQHLKLGFPDSVNDTEQFVGFLTILKEEGFFNKENPYVLFLEVKPWVDEDGDIILANTKRVIDRVWVLIEDQTVSIISSYWEYA